MKQQKNTTTHEKLLIKCANSIYADDVIDALREQDIDSRQQYEETNSKTHGPLYDIDIYVSDEDYERACEILTEEVGSERNTKSIVWCPACHSEKVVPITPYKHRKTMRIVGYFCLIISFFYLILSQRFALRSTPMMIFMAAIVLIGAFLMDLTSKKRCQANYKCRRCRRRFYWPYNNETKVNITS